MPSMPKLDNNVIKLLTYNVMGFGYKNNTKGKKNEIIQYLADSKADIVCLQEYFTNKSSKLMSSQDIATALPMYPYISEIAFNDPKKQNYTYGIAVLSKYPITKTRKLQLNSLYNGAGLFNINIRGKNLTIINNHLESFKLTDEDRSEYAGILTMSGLNNIEVFSGRIQQKLGKAFRIRAKQVELIATEIQKAKKSDACIVACGDFNDTPVSYAHRTLRNVLIDAFAESGYGPGISYNRNFFPFRIDHIMHSDALQAYNCRVDRSINTSDHYPVYCWLRFK
jgi:endonuclease/exonuclease/phosphatase family metal-dependent hydrolase